MTIGARSDAELPSSSGAASIIKAVPHLVFPIPPPFQSFYLELIDSLSNPYIMDKIVAQYSRPSHQNEFYSEQEQQDLTESLPPLSLKFALPPVDNVSCFNIKTTTDLIGAPCHEAALLG